MSEADNDDQQVDLIGHDLLPMDQRPNGPLSLFFYYQQALTNDDRILQCCLSLIKASDDGQCNQGEFPLQLLARYQ